MIFRILTLVIYLEIYLVQHLEEDSQILVDLGVDLVEVLERAVVLIN